MRLTPALACLFCSVALGLGAPVESAEYLVPADYATLQEAIDAAAGSGNAEDEIVLTGLVYASATTTVSAVDFNSGHQLIIRPAETVGRATIASTDPFSLIFDVDAGYVTFQDLDIVRYTTNRSELMRFFQTDHVVVQRCRIGSIWTAPGGLNDLSILFISYPSETVIRNSIFFSYLPAEFSRCIKVFGLDDDRRSIYLYNNVVADYEDYGIDVDDNIGNAGALVLLRNNVAVNHPDAPAAFEPVAYRSHVTGATQVVSSHNVAFATDGAHVEEIAAGAFTITRQTEVAAAFLRFDRADVDGAFFERTWIVAPPWDPNADFYILEPETGALHDGPGKYGITVGEGTPHARDHAVFDDIQKQGRPGGDSLHTDRGVDQVEPGVVLAVRHRHAPGAGLRAAPVRNPARRVTLRYTSAEAGSLTLEVLDVAGRILHRARRDVGAGESGVLDWEGPAGSGVFFYRARLASSEARGKIVVLD